MSAEIPPELVERMCALVRAMEGMGPAYLDGPCFAEARAIAALLPEPVDPDLIEARKIALSVARSRGYLLVPGDFLHGHNDGADSVQTAFEAIKRGRELERAQ